MPIMAMTTNSSTSVKPRGAPLRLAFPRGRLKDRATIRTPAPLDLVPRTFKWWQSIEFSLPFSDRHKRKIDVIAEPRFMIDTRGRRPLANILLPSNPTDYRPGFV